MVTEQKSKYLQIRELADGSKEKTYRLVNTNDLEIIGEIKRLRVGRFMHWALWLSPEFIKELAKEDKGLFYTNGCLKEISSFITKCHSEKAKVSGTEKNRGENVRNK